MVREELKWQNIDADDLPAHVKKSFDAMVEAEFGKAAEERRPHAGGQVSGYEPEGPALRRSVCEHATRRRHSRVPEVQNEMSPSGFPSLAAHHLYLS
jgi:hypothetical protein